MANDYFKQLSSPTFARDVAIIVAAAMGAALIETVGESIAPYDLPSEAYGIILIVVMEVDAVPVSGKQKRMAQLGAGVHTIDNLAARFGVQARVNQAIEGAL